MIQEPQRDLPSGIRGGSDLFDSLIILQNEFFPSALPPIGNLKRWDGSSWVPVTLQRWNGSSWVPATLKRWNGSAWSDI